MPSRTTSLILVSVGALFAIPCAFFLWYTLRLIYVNLITEDAAGHRTGGMLIGAIAFPLASIFFGTVSWSLIRKGFRSLKQ